MKTLKLLEISYASFGNSEGLRSPLGYLKRMAYVNGRANIFHYGSNRCNCVTRSVMASEVHGMIWEFYFTFIIRNLLRDVLKRMISIEAYV